MNVFFVEPKNITESHFELVDQEAQHASKVLRLRVGDEIYATDGHGNQFSGIVELIGKDSISAKITQKKEIPRLQPELVLAMGIIKKRDRLEFAVEKAIELGASEIVLFSSDHSEKEKVRIDRLKTIAISAMKQSLRSWLPEITIFDSLDEVLQQYSYHKILIAHEQAGFESEKADYFEKNEDDKLLLLVGPEGGFSDREITLAKEKLAKIVSLGKFRLRAETAVVAFLSRFL